MTKGKCRPKNQGVYTDKQKFCISVHENQKWQYIDGKQKETDCVKVSRKNVSLYLDKYEFAKDWEIIKEE